MAAVSLASDLRELMSCFDAAGHDRLPVYDGDLDHIVGVVHARDVLRRLRQANALESSCEARDLMRPVPFVPESLPLDEILAELRRRKASMGIVLDEFGGTAGLVTLRDLLEEIVGGLADEFDTSREPIEQLPDRTVALDGLLAVHDVNERFGLAIPEAVYETLGGFVLGQLGGLAAVGGEVSLPNGQRLRIAEMDGRRVARVLLVPASSHLDP